MFDNKDLEIIGDYFDISNGDEGENESSVSIKEESESFDNMCLYSGKKGRVMVIVGSRGNYTYDYDTDDAGYTDYLLFSPIVEVESSAFISDISISGETMKFLVEKVMEIILDFRKKLLKRLCSCKRDFNSNFRIKCEAESDFFYCCEDIINIDPVCRNREEFERMIINLYKFFEHFNKEETERFINKKLGNKKSLKSLKEIFKKLGKENEVESEINELEKILQLRTAYAHSSSNRHLVEFLKFFGIPPPRKDQEFCDLSIFVIERCIKNINKMSEILGELE